MKKENIVQKSTWSAGAKTEGGTKTSTEKFVKIRGEVKGFGGTSTWEYMTKKHALRGEQLYQLQQAMIPAKVQGKQGTLIRVFDPKSCEAKGLNVEDFDSLNEHPQLILYEGYFFGHGGPGDIVVEKRKETGPSLLEQKLQEGSITEVGMKVADSTTMKWLKRLGNFMMMGGFMLVIILVLAIIIAVSVLTK